MAGENVNPPAKNEVDADFYLPSHGWAMLGGDVFDDDRRLVVRRNSGLAEGGVQSQ